MKFSSCIISLALLFSSIVSTNNTLANTPAVAQENIAVENILQQAYTLPLQIDHIAERLALLISKRQMRSLKNKDTAIEILKDVRILMSGTLKDQAAINTIQDPELQAQIAHALLQLCDSLTAYLDAALKQNFNDIKPYDISQLATRRTIPNLTPDMLYSSFDVVSNKIAHLDKKTEQAGLTWYNIATRKLEDKVIKPCNKYHIPLITKIGAFTSLFVLYPTWRYGYLAEPYCPKWIANNIIGRLKDVFGTPIETDGLAGINPENIFAKIKEHGLLPVADLTLSQILSNKHPHYTALAAITTALYLTTWKDKLKPWLTKKGNLTWNFLRGGAYEKKNVEGVWDFEPTARFKDVIGLEEVKESLSLIINFIDNPEQYLRINAAPEKAFLLTGPTRTGKTFIVEALCGEIHDMLKKRGRENEFKFWKVDAADINKYGITDILITAKSYAPVVLFIDEIDLLGLQRVGNNQLLSEFLTSLGTTLDSDPSKQVILIGATNKPETLDKALRQYGRLGKEIRFEYPALRFRTKYLERELHNMALDPAQFDVDTLAQKTQSKSFEDLRAIIRNAMIRSWTRGQQLTSALLEESLDTEIRHIITADRMELSEAEKQILATHFAGRALATMLLDTHAQLDKVTIKAVMTDLREEMQWEEIMQREEKDKQQKISYGSLFTKHPCDTIKLSTHDHIVNEIKTLLAGFMAEELLLDSCSYTCHSENSERAYALTESLMFEGLNPQKLSKGIYRDLADKAFRLFTQYKQEIKALLAQHRVELQAITDALKEHDTLTDAQIKQIIEPGSIETPDTSSKDNQADAQEQTTIAAA